MKRLVMESSIKLILDFLRITKLHTIFRPVYSGKGHILMLHRIVPKINRKKIINNELELSQKELEKCIIYYLENDYLFVSLDELHKIIAQKKKMNNKIVSITFDDGYEDVLINGYPILKKYEIPFAINLTTGFPDETAVFWWYLLEDLLLKHDKIRFAINDHRYSFNCRTTLDKYLVFRKIRGIILRSHLDDYMARLSSIFEPYHIDLFDKTKELALSWDQIKTLSADPKVTIGAHTVNHLALNKISPEAVKKEVLGSVRRIEGKLGQKVNHFSYPFGRTESGPREFDIVRSCGFKTATTTRFANIFDEHCHNLCCLPRIYKFGNLPKIKYLEVFASGALSALIYKFNKIVTD